MENYYLKKKKCNKCGEEKSLIDFSSKINTCKICKNEYLRKKRRQLGSQEKKYYQFGKVSIG